MSPMGWPLGFRQFDSSSHITRKQASGWHGRPPVQGYILHPVPTEASRPQRTIL
uniref:Uncharacterized protein n=1 Tax=Picea glauca TaxID=3330 RepID=A0A101M2B5_PICGL|nr:hypothetical protein ABT39_MTgene2932 [Picea glauca]